MVLGWPWSKWRAALGWRRPAGTSSLSTLGGSRPDGLLGFVSLCWVWGGNVCVDRVFIMEGNNDVVVISENNPMKTNAKQKKKSD